MLTAVEVLEHLERKLETLLQAGEEGLPERLEEMSHFVREIAEAALVAGDEVTLQEARRLAARLGPFGLGAAVSGKPARPAISRPSHYVCPRCGQRFRAAAGRLERLGTPLCAACTRELLAGIRL
ncbi:MAG: hypothetical protein ACP5OO_00860 [Chloroflexia bacterium]